MACSVDMTSWVGQTGISFTLTLKEDRHSSSSFYIEIFSKNSNLYTQRVKIAPNFFKVQNKTKKFGLEYEATNE